MSERIRSMMKAVVIQRFGAPDTLTLEQVPLPSVGAEEILVRLSAAGVNPKDVLVRKGKFRLFTGRRFPMQLGYDFSGVVVKRGKYIRHLKLGDYVFGMINGWQGATYAEYVKVKATECAVVPPRLKPDEAAGVPLAGQTALQALRDIGNVQEGDRVIINGASGGVGTLAIQLAKILGAHVTAVSSDQNSRLCTSLGADRIIDYAATDLDSLEEQFAVFFDVFGNRSFGRVRRLLAPDGVYITTVPGWRIMWDRLWTRFFSSQKARLVVVFSRAADVEYLGELVDHGQLRPVIDRRYALKDVAEAHAYVETKRARGKVILLPRG
ncbi:MAG: NAD(P)-dependent alcohol dehydrogenase [Pseudomonadota bacterium]